MLSIIGTRYLNQVMCSSARVVISVHRPRPSLLAHRERFSTCNYVNILKWRGRHMHHCACGSKHHNSSLSQQINKNVLLSQSSRLMPMIFRTLAKKSSAQHEEKLRVKDCVRSGYDLIYKAPMEWYIVLAQGISTLSLLLLSVGGIYITVQENTKISSMATKIGDIVDSNEQLLIMAAALAVASVAIRILVSNYPLRIYHCNGSYISVFASQIPLQTKALAFRKGDVKHLEPKGIFAILPWKDAKYTMGKKEVILLENFFRKPADFNTMIETSSN